MYKHGRIKALILAGLLMLPSASAMAQQATGQVVVEMIVIPCLPGMRPEECGLKVSVTGGTAELTLTTGELLTVVPGTAVIVSGAGIVSEAPQTGTILDFASAGSSSQTATGSAGAAGGVSGQTAALPSGGSGSGSGTPASGGTGSGSGGSFGGGGSVGGGSGSGSIGGGSLTGGGGTTVVSGGGATTPMTPAPQ